LRRQHLVADDNTAGAVDAAGSGDHRDLVLLHDEGDAGSEAVHRIRLLLQHRVEIELEAVDHDAEAGEILRRGLVEFGGMQQRFGGDAADIEAGAAELVALLDQGGLEAELGAARGAVVAARPRADDDDVVAIAHVRNPSARKSRELYAPNPKGQPTE